eukprot:g3565.t1
MMDWTDRHFRALMRILSPRAVLYTEMHVAQMLRYAPQEKVHQALDFDRDWEGKVVAQLGGSNPSLMAHAAHLCESYGYDEININVGCPSPKVAGAGQFGASLMRDPDCVSQLAEAAMNAVGGRLPITVKCRLGVLDSISELTDDIATCGNDEECAFDSLATFMTRLESADVKHFIVHARCAVLGGITTTRENRNVPPLMYNVVERIAREFPDIMISLNGGIRTSDQVLEYLPNIETKGKISGVMVGRLVRDDPFALVELDRTIFGIDNYDVSREDVLRRYVLYLQSLASNVSNTNSGANGVSAHRLVKPIINLFKGQSRGGRFRQVISDELSRYKMLCGTDKGKTRAGLTDVAPFASECIEVAFQRAFLHRNQNDGIISSCSVERKCNIN